MCSLISSLNPHYYCKSFFVCLLCRCKAGKIEISRESVLVGGLASENVRWANRIQQFKKNEESLPGDVLLVSAFVSYVGSFTRKYRQQLMEDKWKPFLSSASVRIDHTKLISSTVDEHQFKPPFLCSRKCPSRLASISSPSWPMTPSLLAGTIRAFPAIECPRKMPSYWPRRSAGRCWLTRSCRAWDGWRECTVRNCRSFGLAKKGNESDFVLCSGWNLNPHKFCGRFYRYLDQLEYSISSGLPTFIENMDEHLDPILDPLVSRNTVKKGR